MSAVCLPGSEQVWGLYLITTRLNSLRQWRLIWRGGPGLSLPDFVPNTITPLFRYPAVFYNFAIFQCQGQAFWRVFIEFPAGPCCWGHFFPAFTVTLLFPLKPSFLSFFFLCFLFSISRQIKRKLERHLITNYVLSAAFHCYHHVCNKLKNPAPSISNPPAYLLLKVLVTHLSPLGNII